jgi:hypothetical protein
MIIKKILINNNRRFLIDIASASYVMLYSKEHRSYFKIRKSEVLRLAEYKEILYWMTRDICVNGDLSMVVL